MSVLGSSRMVPAGTGGGTGPQGPQGPQGNQGAAGTSGQTAWASVTAVTSPDLPYTATAGELVLANDTSGGLTVNLPTAQPVGTIVGLVVTTRPDSHVILTTTDGSTISGQASVTFPGSASSQWAFIVAAWDGSNWEITSEVVTAAAVLAILAAAQSVVIAGSLATGGGTASGSNSFAAAGGTAVTPDSVAFAPSGLAYSSSMFAHGTGSNTNLGQNQWAVVVAWATTSDATPTTLYGDTAGTVFTIQDQTATPVWDKTILVHVELVARRTDVPGTASGWDMWVLLDGDGVSSYRIVGSPALILRYQDVAATTWTMAPSVSSNGLVLTVTGAAATDISWEATVWTSEVQG